MSEIKNILVLCAGNVGRSILIATALEQELKGSGLSVVSRGLREPTTIRNIRTANPEMLKLFEAMQERNELIAGKQVAPILQKLKKHTPTVVTKTDLLKADIVITVSPSLLSELKGKFAGQVPNLEKKSFTAREYITKVVHKKVNATLLGKRGRVLDHIYYDTQERKWKPKPGIVEILPLKAKAPQPKLKKHLSECVRIGATIGKHLRTRPR